MNEPCARCYPLASSLDQMKRRDEQYHRNSVSWRSIDLLNGTFGLPLYPLISKKSRMESNFTVFYFTYCYLHHKYPITFITFIRTRIDLAKSLASNLRATKIVVSRSKTSSSIFYSTHSIDTISIHWLSLAVRHYQRINIYVVMLWQFETICVETCIREAYVLQGLSISLNSIKNVEHKNISMISTEHDINRLHPDLLHLHSFILLCTHIYINIKLSACIHTIWMQKRRIGKERNSNRL